MFLVRWVHRGLCSDLIPAVAVVDVCEWLEGNEEAKAKLSLERIEVDGFKGLVTYSQGNTASSRKVLQPHPSSSSRSVATSSHRPPLQPPPSPQKLLPLLEGFLSKGLPDQ